MPPAIRPYQPSDQPSVLDLLRLNTPAYFAPEEEADLLRYLAVDREDYFVIESDGKVIGCGGINTSPDKKTGIISWDMIHPAMHGKGLGGQLTQYRIKHLRDAYQVKEIIVRTTQLAYRFYEKQGFVLEEVKADFWAKGYDLYFMKLG